MPILLPEEQYFISNFTERTIDVNNSRLGPFFSQCLKIAESNYDRNTLTLQIHAEYKKRFLNSINNIKSAFMVSIPPKESLIASEHNNYYSYSKEELSSVLSYFTNEYNNATFSSGAHIETFVPFGASHFNSIFQWSLTKTSFAVLSIKNSRKNPGTFNFLEEENCLKYLEIINLEITLMQACGFLLVLTVLIDNKCKSPFLNLIMSIIKMNQFVEIHFTFDEQDDDDNNDNDDKNKLKFKEVFKQIYKLFSDDFISYFYLYSTVGQFDDNEIEKKLENNPFFNHIVYSIPIKEIFNDNDFKKDNNEFLVCDNGFECDMIEINLCNIPLYETDNEEIDITPLDMSGKIKAYINKYDFFEWSQPRIKAIFEDGSVRFVQFDDIHVMKPELYVSDTLYLSKTKCESIYTVKNISRNNEYDTFEISQLSKLDNISLLDYISQKFYEDGIELYHNQLLAIYEASNLLTLSTKQKKSNSFKGTIYQVETGEGKSFIIQGLSAILAIKQKTVHIVTSNIALAFRDYQKSCNFFEKIGLKTAVLLHYDELQQIVTSENSKLTKIDESIFDKELFHNSSNMNISVCGMNNNQEIISERPQIVFSTITNFEGFYLRLMESFPSYISEYFSPCCLIIDEADTILLDEITNGTILSKPMMSNSEEILTFVYKQKKKGLPAEKVHELIIKKWPKCTDLKVQDVIEMYSEIDIVNDPDFCHGKKYSVENAKLEDIKESLGIYNDDDDECLVEKIQRIIEETKSKVDDVKNQVIHKITSKFKRKKKEKTKEKDTDKEEEEEEEENLDEKYQKKIIIPFDYNSKGYLEPNKEFSGFIHQFIAIKEKLNNKKNKNMIIKKISMNYLYASHPIFVSIYSNVCGFTGTIGNQYDKKVLKEQYLLNTFIIPRHLPNLRVDLPIIICHDSIERNNKIVQETIEFHNRGLPILIVCQELKDIIDISSILKKCNISAYLIDGKTFENKPQFFFGKNGAVTIGTNLCGRGTNIQVVDKPLHVIVTYFSSNVRVMQQAFGRTGRQGKKGTSRIICTENQYLAAVNIFNGKEIKEVLNEFEYKNILQAKFIKKFSDKRKWIFDANITNQDVDSYLKILHKSMINVNRYSAFNYEFPLCMSIDTFLDIQSQKIFSLYNCPDCKYTWMLFQRYIREMILESWSLFINTSRRKFESQNEIKSYFKFLETGSNKLFDTISAYIPKPSLNIKSDIVSTFVQIYSKVISNHQDDILKSFEENTSFSLKKKTGKFCVFKFGFFPYNLVDKSGAKINQFENEDQKINYIYDPELKYVQKKPKGSGFNLVSITQNIDGIFDLICQKINEVIGGYIGLKFFLRRTLSGCEFGVSFDLHLDDKQPKLNCLIDTSPLFMFTIHLKSRFPLLAGILIIGLVYLAKVASTIKDLILNLPETLAVKVTKVTVLTLLETFAKKSLNDAITNIIDKISDLLKDKVKSQIKNLKKIDQNFGCFFEKLLEISLMHDWSNSAEKISKYFDGKFHIPENISEFVSDIIPVEPLLNLGFLLIICFAAFITNFNFKMKVKYDAATQAEKYNNEQDPEKALEENKQYADSK